MASRGLRTRPAPASSSPQTSIRSGLRNSGLADRDNQSSLPPAKRRRYSDSQEQSQNVHVAATSPNLVIAGIRPSQWPFATSSSSQPPASAVSNGHSPDNVPSGQHISSQPRTISARNPLKRRATHDESYAEYNTDEFSYEDDSEDPLHHSIPAPLASRTSSENRAHLAATDKSAPSITVQATHGSPADDKVSQDGNAALAIDQISQTKSHDNGGSLNNRSALRTSMLTPSTNNQAEPASRELSPSIGLADNPEFKTGRTSTPMTQPDDLPEELPGPFMERQATPPSFADEAAKLHHQLFAPLTNPTAFSDLLTSHSPSDRSTETLWALAAATQEALVAWQDEYLRLDLMTAPAQHPPKKPGTGGRQPLEHRLAENAKEIELWGHILGVEGIEYPATRRGAYAGLGYDAPVPVKPSAPLDISDGRRARRRGADAKLTDGVQLSETENGRNDKRARKPVRRFDVGSNGVTGRKRRRGAQQGEDESGSEFMADADAGGPRKRGRLDQIREEDGWEISSNSAGEDEASDRTSVPPPTRGGAGRGRGGRGRGGRGRGQSRAAAAPAHGEIPPSPAAAAAAQPASVAVQPSNGILEGSTGPNSQRKPKPKSEKRSSSMTAWWAERKRKAHEERMKAMTERGQAPDSSGAPEPPVSSTPAMQVAPQPATTAPFAVSTMRPSFERGPPTAPATSHTQQAHPVAFQPSYHSITGPQGPPPATPQYTGAGAAAGAMPHVQQHQTSYRQQPQWYPHGYPGMPPPGTAYAGPPAPGHGHAQPPSQPHLMPHAEYRIMNAR